MARPRRLRRSELLTLDWDDIDLERRLIQVRVANGGRVRMVPIDAALPLFVSYLQTREPQTDPRCSSAFTTSDCP